MNVIDRLEYLQAMLKEYERLQRTTRGKRFRRDATRSVTYYRLEVDRVKRLLEQQVATPEDLIDRIINDGPGAELG